MKKNGITLVSWNVAGARWLELPSRNSGESSGPSREDTQERLNAELRRLVDRYSPHVVALQEIVEYSPGGNWTKRDSLLSPPTKYKYLPATLVDSLHFPEQDKWQNVRRRGTWPVEACFGQGNCFLVREDVEVFPAISLPRTGVTFADWIRVRLNGVDERRYVGSLISTLWLESGMYLGDRDTEPRACNVLHFLIALDSCGGQTEAGIPLDVFVLNTHLTTLLEECPESSGALRRASLDATRARTNQLSRVMEDVVLRREAWQKKGFTVRGKPRHLTAVETHQIFFHTSFS